MPFSPRLFDLSFPVVGMALVCSALPLKAQEVRVCQSPDSLVVENHHSKKGLVKSIGVLDTRLHLFIYVPPTTGEWTLGIFDQADDMAVGKASEFVLTAPDGSEMQTLDKGQRGAWSDYTIATQGRWGVWRLSVLGPEDGEEKGAKARNAFMARTMGEVDLFLKPEAVARVRGLRLGQPLFGGDSVHRFTLQNADFRQVRFSLLGTKTGAENHPTLKLNWPGASVLKGTLSNDDRLAKGLGFETIDYAAPTSEASLLPLEVGEVRGTYGLGISQEARLFFNAKPLMPLPRRVRVKSVDENGRGVAARFDVTSGQTSNEANTFYASSQGEGEFWAIPGVNYEIRASRGEEFAVAQSRLAAGASEVRLVLKRHFPAMKGWYSGDTHCHTAFYDGTDSPAQMIEAGKAAGLDWMAVTEHAHSEKTERTQRANSEAAMGNEDERFIVIPGMEYTGPRFHANVLGKVVEIESGARLQRVLEVVRAANTAEVPVLAQLNHPTLGKTARQEALDVTGLGMVELWNSEEPEGTELWWSLLNKGQRVVADTGSDSHHRKNLALGSRRVYVYLGGEALTATNILRALGAGRSFLSRGALLNVTLGGERPGGTIKLTGAPLELKLDVAGTRPLERVDIISQGVVVKSFDLAGATRWKNAGSLAVKAGWYVAQVWERGDKTPVAMSNPIWVEGN